MIDKITQRLFLFIVPALMIVNLMVAGYLRVVVYEEGKLEKEFQDADCKRLNEERIKSILPLFTFVRPSLPPEDVPIIPESVIDVIKEMESFRGRAYSDKSGVLTIGYGFTRNVLKINKWDTMTEEEADCFLRELIESQYVPFISDVIHVPLTRHQIGALVSLVHNIGVTAFRKSSLVALLNEHDYLGAAAEFDKWVKVRGRACKGLTRRRETEKQIFLSYFMGHDELIN